ncbi:MAG: hypothetical protein JXA73_14105 [Acidobacteria bacterium]|nr:hypothetical protein [Acidobacteriota bacterium]
MKPRKAEADSDGLNAVKLHAEELLKVIDDINLARALGVCPGMLRVMTQNRLYEEIPEKAGAILARLEALSAMIENNELQNWFVTDGAIVMHAIAQKALLSAAANHPLSIINGDITFNKESFLRMTLALTEPGGSQIN